MGITVVPIGITDSDILKGLSQGLGKTFSQGVRIGREVPLPGASYNPERRQYSSSRILETLRTQKTQSSELILGITDVDLYVPSLNFVFGEADPGSGVVIISLARLRQEFYGLQPEDLLFRQRALKEAVHELGHALGLEHCHLPDCIMYFSNSIDDTDRKGSGFCRLCKARLGP